MWLGTNELCSGLVINFFFLQDKFKLKLVAEIIVANNIAYNGIFSTSYRLRANYRMKNIHG